MEILILAFLFATGKFILLVKFFPIRKVLYFEKWIDLFFTVALPLIFLGTFSGAVLAVFSGLFLSLYLLIARKIVGTQAPDWIARRSRNRF